MSNFKKDILHENEDKSDVRLNRFLVMRVFVPEEKQIV